MQQLFELKPAEVSAHRSEGGFEAGLPATGRLLFSFTSLRFGVLGLGLKFISISLSFRV